MLTTMRARRGNHARLRVRRALWDQLMREMARRSNGRTEAGAFLLGNRDGDGRTITHLCYFDDLDATSLAGGIALSGLAFSKLWDLCDAENLRVLADVHSHPRRWVEQSSIDQAHPMIARAGHVGLIVPDYAQGRVRAKAVGVHTYDGVNWRSSFGSEAARLLFIRRLL